MRTREIPELTKKNLYNFWRKVDKTPGQGPDGDCWEWTGCRIPQGYGQFGIAEKVYRTHRISYTFAKGPIPRGLCVLHSCDNPPCINPSHLWLGTKLDNARDREQKGRGNQVSGDRSGARLHPEKIVRGDNHYSRTRPECLARGKKNGSYTKPEKRPRGESHGCSKLNEKEVLEIRELHRAGSLSHFELAQLYKVTDVSIGNIINGKTWTHI